MMRQFIAVILALVFSGSASASYSFLDADQVYGSKSSAKKSYKKKYTKTRYAKKKGYRIKKSKRYSKKRVVRKSYNKKKSVVKKQIRVARASSKKLQKKPAVKQQVAMQQVKKNAKSVPQIKVTKANVDCLARNIFFEAGVESTRGKIAVANVTLNRVKSIHYPKSVCGVVYQKNRRACAFSWTCDRKSNNPPRKARTYKESVAIARLALSGALKDVTGESDHYHANYVKPKWRKKMKKKVVIGQHIFYKSKRG